MLQADVEELRARLEEKNRLIEKKTQSTLGAVQDRNRMQNELTELKDHMDIKDRKINVLQRKVMENCRIKATLNYYKTKMKSIAVRCFVTTCKSMHTS